MTQPSYAKKLHDLFQLEFFGMKLGLDNIRALLAELGHPQDKFESIHIAGTNGKGSVASMLSAVHQADGKKVGLFTSPHLIDFRERIRINGEMISERDVAVFLERIWPTVEALNATFFEVTTAMAFDYFAKERVDIAIIETGLGGRLDATNVLKHPLATIITSIGFDHMAQLGNTLEEIASEKAGILKQGVPAIVRCPEAVEHVFVDRAKMLGAPLILLNRAKHISELQSDLQGDHQRENVETVLVALDVLSKRPSDSAIESGLARTSELSGLRGRLQQIEHEAASEKGVRVTIDVAHNAPAFERLAEHYLAQGIQPLVVIGIMKDKEVEKILYQISRFAKLIVATSTSSQRALPAIDLAAHSPDHLVTKPSESVREAFLLALESAEFGDEILITGSHYVVGEFLQNFRGNG